MSVLSSAVSKSSKQWYRYRKLARRYRNKRWTIIMLHEALAQDKFDELIDDLRPHCTFVSLNDGLAIGVPVAATIGATGDLTIESIVGDILFGQNQKLSVIGNFGAFTLNTFQSGDINALGNIDIMAGDINLLGRPAGMVLLSNGQMVMDDGLDIVAEIRDRTLARLLGATFARAA